MSRRSDLPRRRLLQGAGAVAAGLALAPTGARAAVKPNIVFILADDLGVADPGFSAKTGFDSSLQVVGDAITVSDVGAVRFPAVGGGDLGQHGPVPVGPGLG